MRIFLLLLSLKLRLLLRHTASKNRIAVLMLVLYFPFVSLKSYDLGQQALTLESRGPAWLVPLVVALAYCLWLVLAFIQELQFSYILNLAQRTSDNEYLFMLPVPLPAVMLVKAIERMTTDMMLPVILFGGLGFASAVDAPAIARVVLVALVISTSLLIGMAFFLFYLALSRRYSPQQIKNLAFLAQPLALLPLFAPVVIERYWDGPRVIEWLSRWSGMFGRLPPYAFAQGLMTWSQGGARACVVGLAAVIALLVLICWLLSALQRSGWGFLPEDSGAGAPASARLVWPERRPFRGFLWKDFLQVVRDKNMLTNGLLVPLAFLIYFLFTLSGEIQHSPDALTPALLFFCFYFHGFGAMNAVGMEGQGIALVRSMPLSPVRFLLDKVLFWAAFSWLALVPVFLAVAQQFRLPAGSLIPGLLWLAVAAPTLAALGVALSAIFPNFESKMLQQGSTGAGKGLFFVMGAMFLQAALSGDTAMRIRGVMVFEGLVVSVLMVAARSIETLDDPGGLPRGRLFVTDAITILLGMFIASGPVFFVLHALLPHNPPSYLTFLTILIVDPVTGQFCWRYLDERMGSAWNALGLSREDRRWAPGLAVVGGVVFTGLLELTYRLTPYLPEAVQDFMNQALKLMRPYFAHPDGSLLLIVFAVVVVAPFVEEVLFRGIVFTALKQSGFTRPGAILASALMFALVHPVLNVVAVLLLGIALAWVYDRTRSIAAPMLLHCVANGLGMAWTWVHAAGP